MNALIYASKKTIELSDVELKGLINFSSEKNKRQSITGFLAHSENYYLQYLEGSKEVIQNLMDSIRRDSRHENINELELDISQRRCPDWDMKELDNSLSDAISHEQLIYTLIDKVAPSLGKEEVAKIVVKIIHQVLYPKH